MDTINEVDDLIRYDILTQDAMRGVLKKVLQEVARTGLPGEHHFYITFDTNYSGVRMSKVMKEKYPEEMTIVVQHQFWDLETYDSGFSISLSFNNVPETLYIPFNAIQGFFDPSVQFGLQFDVVVEEEQQEEPVRTLSPVKDQSDKGAKAAPKKAVGKKTKAGDDAQEGELGPKLPDGEANDDEKPTSADVVSLDAFRKK